MQQYVSLFCVFCMFNIGDTQSEYSIFAGAKLQRPAFLAHFSNYSSSSLVSRTPLSVSSWMKSLPLWFFFLTKFSEYVFAVFTVFHW